MCADGKGKTWRVLFCDIFPQIDLACEPEELESSLRFPAAEPVEVHVHVLGFARNDGLVGHANWC